jgi:hypothetical protein
MPSLYERHLERKKKKVTKVSYLQSEDECASEYEEINLPMARNECLNSNGYL